MNTILNKNLVSALFNETRISILSLLFRNSDQAFYLRQISRATGSALRAVQREVKNLSEAGIIKRTVIGRHVYYQADRDCPIFSELKSIVIKTAGLVDILRAVLAPIENRITLAIIYGSFASGKERQNSDIDLLVVGETTFAEIVTALQPAQIKLAREVNPTVYSSSEFKERIAAGNHFIKSVLSGKCILVFGDKFEFAGLAKKRLA